MTQEPQETDHFRKPPRRRKGALAIVQNSAGGVLVGARESDDDDSPRWYLPGGCVNRNENNHDGLVRAAEYRLGVTLKPGRLVVVHRMPEEWHGEGDQRYLSREGDNYVYNAGKHDYAPGDFTFGPDVVEVRYMLPAEFDEFLPPFMTWRIQTALRVIETDGHVEELEGHPVVV